MGFGATNRRDRLAWHMRRSGASLRVSWRCTASPWGLLPCCWQVAARLCLHVRGIGKTAGYTSAADEFPLSGAHPGACRPGRLFRFQTVPPQKRAMTSREADALAASSTSACQCCSSTAKRDTFVPTWMGRAGLYGGLRRAKAALAGAGRAPRHELCRGARRICAACARFWPLAALARRAGRNRAAAGGRAGVAQIPAGQGGARRAGPEKVTGR